jgi:Tol biopolymer transport system component
VVRDVDSGALIWRSRRHPGRPVQLSWSPSGTRLLLVTSAGGWLYLPGQSPPLSLRLAVRGPVVAAAASPDGRRLALVRGGRAPQLELADLTAPERPARTVVGIAVDQPTWSPDSRWLLVSQPAAGSWLFVRVARRPRILAVSGVAGRFGGTGSGPVHIDGWCCGLAG